MGPGYLSRYSGSLRDGQAGDRIPVVGEFPAPVQPGFGAQPAPFFNEYRVFHGNKERSGRGVFHPPTSRAEVDGKVKLQLRFPSGPSWPDLG